MTDTACSRTPAYFERIYAANEDPWQFRSSCYEIDKYAATMAALPARRFASCLEIGCSIGELTHLLSERCDAVLGVDTAAAPLRVARVRCAGRPGVKFEKMHVPAAWPEGTWDLIVLSEVLYFLSPADIDAVAAHAQQNLAAAGMIMLVNWLGTSNNPCSGDDAAASFIAAAHQLRTTRQTRHEGYRIDILAK